MAKRVLVDQAANVDTLFDQLEEGEVLRIGYSYGSNPDSGLYLYTRDQQELERRMSPAGSSLVTFYGVPEDEM